MLGATFDRSAWCGYAGTRLSLARTNLSLTQTYRNQVLRLASTLLPRRDRITRNWAIVTAASLLRLALGFLGSVVVARALGPETFGTYAILGIIAVVVGIIVDPGLTPVAVTSIASAWSNDSDLAALRAQVFVWMRAAIASFAILALAAVLWAVRGHLLGTRADPLLISLTLVGVLATSVSGALASVLQAIGSFGRLSFVLIVNSLLTVMLAVALSATGHLNLVNAVTVLGIGTSFLSVVLSIALLPRSMRPRLPESALVAREGRSMLKFGRWLWVGDLLGLLSGRIDLPVAALWLDPATFGAYAVALNFATKADVVNHSLFTVLLPESASVPSREATRRFLTAGLRRSAPVAGLFVVAIALTSPLIDLTYGPRFSSAAPMLAGLLVAAIVDLLVAPVLILPYHFKQPRVLAVSDAARVVAMVGLSFLFVPLIGVTGLILARIISRFVGVVPVVVGLVFGRQRTVNPI